MYLNVMVTILVGLVLFWILYQILYQLIYLNFFHKPFKTLAKHTGKSPEYYDQTSDMRAAFDKGDFQRVLEICEEILRECPYETTALGYKAGSLYQLEQYAEAKKIFELLESLPGGQDCSKMIEKIKAMES